MYKLECPYCATENELIDLCDCEGEHNEHECENCGKLFTFGIETHFEVYSEKADCLNGGEHQWRRGSHHKTCNSCGFIENHQV